MDYKRNNETERILLIIDPQNDFIEGGSLAVESGKQVLEDIIKYLKETTVSYDSIFVTYDTHPKTHCSFKENGGIWPEHCVINTNGEKLYSPLKKYLSELSDYYTHKNSSPYKILYLGKGFDESYEQYSILTPDNIGNLTISGVLFNDYIENSGNIKIDICGIAGDFCVLNTASDIIKMYGNDCLRVLIPYIASIDGGKKINEFIKENNIDHI